MMALSDLIKEIGRGAKGARDLSTEDAQLLFKAMLSGEVPDLELGAILLSLRIKGESDDELVGFCAAMQSTTRTVTTNTPLVVLPSYNGVRRQPNLLPLLALMLRDAGLHVLVHGRHDFDNRRLVEWHGEIAVGRVTRRADQQRPRGRTPPGVAEKVAGRT